MLNFDLNVEWSHTNYHGEPAYSATVKLPDLLDGYADITIGFGEEMGGWSVLVYGNRPEEFMSPPMHEIHVPKNAQLTRESALQMQAESLFALLLWAAGLLSEMEPTTV